MIAASETHAEFREPPISEMTLGAWFQPLQPWNLHVYGLYYNTIRSRFPRFETAPAVPPPSSGTVIRSPIFPFTRALYSDAQNVRLVQIQQNMFFTNWRRMTPADEYPRFGNQRALFLAEWEALRSLLSVEGVSVPIPLYAVVSYVNQEPVPTDSTVGRVMSETVRALPALPDATTLIVPRTQSLSSVYDMPSGLGEISISITPAIRASDTTPTVQFQLTTTQSLSEQTTDGLLQAFDDGNKCLQDAFLDLTTAEARARWGQK